jgi:hypothetical protein
MSKRGGLWYAKIKGIVHIKFEDKGRAKNIGINTSLLEGRN